MRKALGLLALLVLVTSASAGIDIYLTRAADFEAMTDDSKYETGEADFSYSAHSGAYGFTGRPDYGPPHCPFIQEPGTTQSYYIWAGITLESASTPEVSKVSLYRLDLRGSTATNFTFGPVVDGTDQGGVFYRQVTGTAKRWDGTGPLLFDRDFCTSNGGGVSVQETGAFDDLGYKTGAGLNARFDILLGTVDVTAGTLAGGVTIDPGPLYVGVKEYHRSGASTYVLDHDYDGASGGFYPKLSINGVHVDQNGGGSWVITDIAEPDSLLLLGLGLLLLRRR